MAAVARLTVQDDDLHAFVDGMLPPESAMRVAALLKWDWRARTRVDTYRNQCAELRTLYNNCLAEPVPAAMRKQIQAARRLAERAKAELGGSP